jgi:hypothetical protein
MAATEEVFLKLVFDADDAKRDLDRMRTGAETMGGAVDKVSTSVANLRKQQLDLASALATAGAATQKDTVLVTALRQELERTTAALNSFGASQARVAQQSAQFFPVHAQLTDTVTAQKRGFLDLTDAGKRLQQQIGPQAAAISSIANALGDSNSQTGRAVQMAGQLAAAWGAGGPVGVAVVGLSAGVIALTQHWEDLIRAQDEALTKQYAQSDAFIDERKSVEKRLAALRNEAGGPETAAMAFERVQKEIDDATRRRDEARANRDRAGWANLNKTIALLEQVQGLEAARAASKSGKAAGRTAGVGGAGNMFDPLLAEADPSGLMSPLMADAEARLAARDAFEAEANRRNEEAWAAELEGQAEHDAAIVELARNRLDEIAALEAANNARIADGASMAFGQAVTAANSYFAMLAAGEEHAAEKATAAFLSGVGNQLVGLGTKAVIEGALMNLALPGTGIPLMAGGAAAIGVGIGMGAGGAALGASIPSGSSSGGSLDRGVNSGRAGSGAGGGNGGGQVVINYVHGVYGTGPTEIAKATQEGIKTARRRGLPL